MAGPTTLGAIVLALLCGPTALPAPQPPADGDQPLLRLARVEDPAALRIGRVVPDLEFTTLRGEKRSLSGELKDRKAVVVAMVGATCPLSIAYSPRLAELESQWAQRGVGVIYVNAVEADTTIDMEAQVKKYRLRGPYAPDRERALCRALGVRTTTEAFVLDPSRTLVYRGAVDDQHAIGGSLPAPRQSFLADAVESLLGGSARPRIRATSAPGCLVSCPSETVPAPTGPATYSGRIAWIIRENCITCHRPGGAAPFALDTYEAVSGRAKMVQAVVRDGLMPPWHGASHPAGEPSPWVNDRSLAPEDREALLDWLGSDRPRGDDAAPPSPPPLSHTWSIGEPDLLATTSGVRTPAQGGVSYGRVMVAFNPPGPREDRWVSAIEFRPVDAGTIQHALIWILAPGNALPEPDAPPANLELLGAYSPGDNVIRYPAGAARKIRAGSIFLVDLHGQSMGKDALSALRIALRWAPADKAPAWSIRSISASAAAPGDELPEPDASLRLPIPTGARLLAIHPYMPSRGRSFEIDVAGAGTKVEAVLRAPKYDSRWQIRYEFLEPREVGGTSLLMRGRYAPLDAAQPTPLQVELGPKSMLLTAELIEPASQKR